MKSLAIILSTLIVIPVLLDSSAQGESGAVKQSTRPRRVLYNFDGDSCMFTRAGGKGPVVITVDDVQRLIEEVAYDGSQVDTVLVCINAQVMYYPTKIGTQRGTLSSPEERAKWPGSQRQMFENLQRFFTVGVDPYAVMLAVRVPSNYGRTPPTPETARLLGCDVPAWVQRGWIDFIAVSEFLFERGDLPIGLWKQAIMTVPIYGGIECTKGSGQKNLTADEYRHAATQLIKAGADGAYLFNFFTSREGGEQAYEPPFEVLRDLGPLSGK